MQEPGATMLTMTRIMRPCSIKLDVDMAVRHARILK